MDHLLHLLQLLQLLWIPPSQPTMGCGSFDNSCCANHDTISPVNMASPVVLMTLPRDASVTMELMKLLPGGPATQLLLLQSIITIMTVVMVLALVPLVCAIQCRGRRRTWQQLGGRWHFMCSACCSLRFTRYRATHSSSKLCLPSLVVPNCSSCSVQVCVFNGWLHEQVQEAIRRAEMG